MGTHPAPSASRAALQQLIDDYGDDSAPVLRVEVAMALYNRGVTLGQLDRAQEELAAYQQLIDDYATPAPRCASSSS